MLCMKDTLDRRHKKNLKKKEKVCHRNYKRAGLAILISDKESFRPKKGTRDKIECFQMIKMYPLRYNKYVHLNKAASK